MDEQTFSRRQSLSLAAMAAGVAALGGCARAQAAPATAAAPAGGSALGGATVGFVSKIDFADPYWTRDTYARLDGDIDPTKEKVGWISGKAFGVRPNEKVRPLFKVEGFSVPIANDPFNFTISAFEPEGPSYGGMQKTVKSRKPFLQNWEYGADGKMVLQTGIDMIYPNALDPKKWVRESSGPMNRVSEQFIYVVDKADVENPNLTHIPAVGSWSRVTPWLPWMLMGQAEGHLNYFTHFGTAKDGIASLPADIVAAARAMDEKWLHAPETDYGPSLSSLENYAREQTPAPVPAGWTPPKSPAMPGQ